MWVKEYVFRFVCAICRTPVAVYSFEPYTAPKLRAEFNGEIVEGYICEECFRQLKESCNAEIPALKYLCHHFERPVVKRKRTIRTILSVVFGNRCREGESNGQA
ncbi:hypothetical protein [Archaeoglobus profundus]|uniref:Uncharacterized protein n=1 Tax=Archaeoglobus profundus (strain DSM 5631 / JCM 9629 / NBRC 100127 / Av18) TaxID=572546 RepID=D2RI40_ARCPA|nr:hypothetical protein [Archaeoglobus profundus]ADB57965.1 hypothetical protein Arcpr_0904 [Archaeoglobus profundus DSM 5631]